MQPHAPASRKAAPPRAPLQRPPHQPGGGATRPGLIIVALLLTAFALSGLAGGFVTRSALDATQVAAQPTKSNKAAATSTSLAQAHATATSGPTTVPVVAAAGFTLRAEASPRTVTPSAAFSVQVTVVARDGVTPVAGLKCFMRAPQQGAALYTSWPPPTVTNSAGVATWRLTTPQVAPGAYAVEVVAFGNDAWSYQWDTSINVIAAA